MNEKKEATVLDAEPPTALKAVNRVSRGLKRFRLMSFDPSAEQLLRAAKARTGLSDFGPDEFEGDMRDFIACFKGSSRLNYSGALGLKQMVGNALERRLCLQRDFKQHPEILKQAVDRPLYVVGFPRSGTTLMQNLLIQHPGCRWMRAWEPMTPFPAKEDWGGPADGRVRKFEAMVAKVKKQFPIQEQIHSWDSPGECWLLLYATFVAPQLLGSLVIEPYRLWWENLPREAFARAYQYYKKQIQYLTWVQQGTHWVLKETSHMMQLDHLLDCFPDARIVQTHRDPVECMASACSLIYYQFRCYDSARNVTPQEIGRLLLAAYSGWAAKNVALRQRLGSASFFDVSYAQLVKDPLNMVRSIYDHFGMEFSVGLKANLEAWTLKNHGANRPRHAYTLEQFGLDARSVNEAFGPYREYFNL